MVPDVEAVHAAAARPPLIPEVQRCILATTNRTSKAFWPSYVAQMTTYSSVKEAAKTIDGLVSEPHFFSNCRTIAPKMFNVSINYGYY